MNPLVIVAIVAVVILLIIVCWFISTNNKLVKLDVKVEESFSGIDVALTKRFDLLNKMFNVAKSYMKFESETLKEIVKMRNPNSCSSVEEYNDCSERMEKFQKQLNVVVENYPTLKSNTTMIQLQDACREVEENLSAARRLYNSNVTLFNQAILTFPNSIVAGMKHFEKKTHFKAEENKRVDVDFNFEF